MSEAFSATENQEGYRSVVTSALDGIIIVDASGNIAEFNAAAEAMFGYRRDDVLGLAMEELIIPERLRDHHRAGMSRFSISRGKLIGRRMEISAMRRDGTEFAAELSITLIGSEEAPKFAAFIRDITQIKAAERELHGREERFGRQRNALVTLTATKALHVPDLSAALRIITETNARTMGVARVSVWRYTPDRTAIACVDMFELEANRHSSGLELKAADYPSYFRALAETDVIAANDAHRDPRTSQFSANYLKPLGITSMLDAPIHLRGALEGVLCFEHVGPQREWTADEKTFAVANANLVSLTLERWERERAEASLRESHRRFELIMRATNDVIYDWDVKKATIWWNDNLERLFGYSLAETGDGFDFWSARLHPADRDRIMTSLDKLLASDLSDWVGEYRFRRRDGTWAEVLDRGSVMRDESGRAQRMVGAMMDLSPIRSAEHALRRSEGQFRALVENALDLVTIVRSDGTISFQNPSSKSVLGYEPGELVGRSLFEYVHPADAEVVRAAMQQAFSDSRVPRQTEFRARHADGSWRILAAAGKRLIGEEPPAILVNARDVTEARETEEALRQSQKMEAIGQLAGGVAHDFNNILTVIHGHAALLHAGAVAGQDATDSAQQIIEAAERAAGLTRQLLMFGRKQMMQVSDVDINEVISQMAKMLRRILEEDIRLVSEYGSNLPAIHADKGMIEQILLNLAVNSRDAMSNGGTLTIGTGVTHISEDAARKNPDASPGTVVRLTVADTGTGIAPENLPHIFDPFFTTKEVGRGTGLGLATVYGIVKQHRGWIEVESEIGRGTTFHVHFPAVNAPVASAAQAASQNAALPRGTETVLVVEDEPGLRMLVSNLLKRLGYTVLIADSGVSALEVWKTRKNDVQLLLTDMVMPEGVSGRELADRLRAERPELKVIYTTGYSADMMGGPGTLPEGSMFLQKPYNPQKLGQTIRDCLDREAS